MEEVKNKGKEELSLCFLHYQHVAAFGESQTKLTRLDSLGKCETDCTPSYSGY